MGGWGGRTLAIFTSWSLLSCPWKNGSRLKICRPQHQGRPAARSAATPISRALPCARALYHACKHASERPDVQRVVVLLKVHEQFGPLEVPGGDTHVVLLARVVELG